MKQFSFTINGKKYDVEIKSVDENIAQVEVNGSLYSVETNQELQVSQTPKLVRPEAVPSNIKTEQKISSPAASKGTGGYIKSPLPGLILDIYVKEGDVVKTGDKLFCLEAMKMENIINSDKEGTVTAIKIQKGDVVMEGDLMIQIG
jgi:biotin carboxyl carrier protein